jgi:hypothetical protein
MERRNHNVVALQPAGAEVINGAAVALGRMSLAELLQLEAECRERLVEAQTDLQIVQYTRESRFPGPEGGAA